ncbi:MAG: hypothetical protein IPH11_10525 [Ignavibacteriales bacterium]|nr:hypothetical protein [Ignavibacteriales bacterium]
MDSLNVKNQNTGEIVPIPPHRCHRNLMILEETHSVNSSHNIVIARRSKCRICGKIFEEADDRGL